MKILQDSITTIVADTPTDVDSDWPISNVYDRYPRNYCKLNQNVQSITLDVSTYDIYPYTNSLYIGNTNALEGTIVIRDLDDTEDLVASDDLIMSPQGYFDPFMQSGVQSFSELWYDFDNQYQGVIARVYLKATGISDISINTAGTGYTAGRLYAKTYSYGSPTGSPGSDAIIQADNPGTGGNSISLSFTGSNSITTAISDWNTANPANTCTLKEGTGSDVPSSQTVALAYGYDSTEFTGEYTVDSSGIITGVTINNQGNGFVIINDEVNAYIYPSDPGGGGSNAVIDAESTLHFGIIRAGFGKEFISFAFGAAEGFQDYSISKSYYNGAEYYKSRDIARVFSGQVIVYVNDANSFHDLCRQSRSNPMAFNLFNTEQRGIVFGKIVELPQSSRNWSDAFQSSTKVIEVL
jgi:hypothetical protein